MVVFRAAVLAVPVLACVSAMTAQTGEVKARSQAELVALRNQKLKSQFLQKSVWTTSFVTAKKLAAGTDQLVLAYFTRSFAPSPASKHLEDSVFTTREFQQLAESVVLFCHVTSKVVGDPDQDLMQRYDGQGYPFMIAIDEAGRPVALFQSEFSLAGVKKFLELEVAGYAKLRARAAKGDRQAKADFLIRRIQLGHLKPSAIQKVLESADYLSPTHRKAIRQGLATLEIREILARIDNKDPTSFNLAAERIVAMKNAGRIPSGSQAPVFWQVILGYADNTENTELFEEALTTIEKLPGAKHPEQWIRRMKLRLRALKFMKQRRRK